MAPCGQRNQKKVLGYDVPDARLLPARLQGFQVRRVSGAFYR